jgi:glutathione S-transferase
MTSRRILHHAPGCALSEAVRVMLVEKRLDHELHKVDVTRFRQLDPAYLAVNASGQLPALEFEGAVLTEAFFILCWLDERFPDPPLGGDDPAARYRVQVIGQLVERAVAPNLAVLEWIERGGDPPTSIALARLPLERRRWWEQAAGGFSLAEERAAETGLARALEECERWLSEHPWLAGNAYTLADILLFPFIDRLDDARRGPAVCAWFERTANRLPPGALTGQKPVVTLGPERGRWG